MISRNHIAAMLPLVLLLGCNGPLSDTSDSDVSSCVPDGAFAVLQAHLLHVDSALGLLVGHPGDREAISFQEAPGFEGPLNYMTLIGPCAEAMSYDEYCDPETSLCSQIECTGQGAGWIVHQRNDGPLTAGDFAFTALTSATRWVDGAEGFDWTASSAGTAGTDDWTTSASGSVIPNGDTWEWTLSETLPGLSSAGPIDLAVTHPGAGALTIGESTIATIDGELAITVTDTCP